MVEQDVKDELGKSEIEKKADELSLGRTGEPTTNEGASESPIEEARKLREELKAQFAEIKTARKELDEILSAAMLSGKSFGAVQNKEPTQEEKDEIRAKQLVDSFLK